MATDRPEPSAAPNRERVVSFEQAVQVCFATPELMDEYRRLTGATLGLDTRSGIARLIDEAAGHNPWESEYAPFFRFVRDVVWLPLLAEGESHGISA